MNKAFVKLFCAILLAHSWAIGQENKSETANDNTASNDIDTYYHSRLVSVSENGVAEGRDASKNKMLDPESLKNFKTHYKVAVNQVLEYGIGSIEKEKGHKVSQMIIWMIENGQKKRILEIMYNNTTDEEVPVEIENARKKWVKLCNEHKPEKLVSELYTEDALYYNRGRLLKGQAALSQEYGYMQNPAYNLQLTPKHVELVSEDTAFEIGRCSGSYPLPYMLVWKKQEDGQWKVYLDSNY